MSLLKLRKLQYITSSYNTQLFLNKNIIYFQLISFTVSLCFTIIGKYYSLERYHTYGCRKNYNTGFPISCPNFRKPTGIDGDSAMMFFGSFIFIILMIIFPVLYQTRTWKSLLLEDIYFYTEDSLKKIGLTDVTYIEKAYKLISNLEGLSHKDQTFDNKIGLVKKRSFLIHIGSCIWSEMFLLYHFKRYKTFCALIILVMISVLFPLFLPIANTFSSTLGLMVSCILFYVLPCFSGILMLILTASIFATHVDFFILSFFIMWTAITLGTIIFAYWKDKKDEIHLIRNTYSRKLQSKQQIEVCLFLRGYCKYFPLIF